MVDNRSDFYSGLESLLTYHDQIGLGPVVVNDGIQSFLDARPLLPSDLFSTTSEGAKSSAVADPHVSQRTSPQAAVRNNESLGDVESEVNGCSLCDLHSKRLYPVPGRGSAPVRLMIVGDWLGLPGGSAVVEDLLFGLQQDQMLFRMLQAMKVPEDKVYITNVIKCAITDDKPPQAKHVQACVDYLKRQIQLLRPEYICTMGMVAARAVLDRSLPLSRLRGRFHGYSLGGDETIPVLTTYHPSYLLQNPEMKKATWQDLQFLAQKMGTL